MKRHIFTLLMIFFVIQRALPHGQIVHQHVVREAFELLEDQKPEMMFSTMKGWIGGIGDDSGIVGNNPWEVGTITAGAYREDAGKTNVLTLGIGAIPVSACPRSARTPGGDTFILNYAVLLEQGGSPRHLLSVMMHF